MVNEFRNEVWSYNDALQKIKKLSTTTGTKLMTKSTKEIRDAAEQTYRWQKKIEKQLCGKKDCGCTLHDSTRSGIKLLVLSTYSFNT